MKIERISERQKSKITKDLSECTLETRKNDKKVEETLEITLIYR